MSNAQTGTEEAAPEAKAARETPEYRENGCDHSHAKSHGGGHSHWLMIVCCIPMLLIAVFLLVGGAGLASLAPAVLCVGMMGLMMVGMSHTRRGG